MAFVTLAHEEFTDSGQTSPRGAPPLLTAILVNKTEGLGLFLPIAAPT